MPVQVSYPGVYIEEVPSGVHTITGVSTSIAAFFGRTAKGPINKAVRCLSYADFLREFGGSHPLSDLATSVKQFIDNGGTDCYVVRLASFSPGVTGEAAVTLRNRPNPDVNGNVLTATAKAPGVWGQDIKLEVDFNTPNPDDSFNLRVVQETNGQVITQEIHSNLSMNPTSPRFAPTFVTQSSKLIMLTLHADMGDQTQAASFINDINNTPAGFSQSRRVFTGANLDDVRINIINQLDAWLNPALPADRRSRFIINVNGTQDCDIDLAGTNVVGAVDMNALGNRIRDSIIPQIQTYMAGLSLSVTFDTFSGDTAAVMRITSDITLPHTSVRIRRAPSNDFAANMMLGLDQGGIEVTRFSNLRPFPSGIFYRGNQNFGDFNSFAAGINTFSGLRQDAINRLTIGDPTAADTVDIDFNLQTVGAANLNFEQQGGGFDGVREKLRLIAQAINASPNATCTAELWGYHLVLKKKSGTINDTVASVGTTSDASLGTGFVLNTRRYCLGAVGTSNFQSAGTPGNDGGAPGAAEYQGNPNSHTGFYALDLVDLFNLMVLPSDREVLAATMETIIGPASVYCQQNRAFLLLDAPDAWSNGYPPTPDANTINPFRSLVVKDHSAVFYPRVQYSDAGIKKFIGPSGIIAGLMARIDSTRGVWKAPAGIEADIRGILGLEVKLTDLENGVLNKLAVNCLRQFPSGFVNWGARTMDGSDDIGSEWKYIPIRRLALFLEESLYRGTKWVVFEPNDEPLWAKIRLNLNAFMMGLFRQGAFQGSTPDKAFYVKCDDETTTQADRNLGIVNIEVGFAPLKPAEFVVIKIQQIAGEL